MKLYRGIIYVSPKAWKTWLKSIREKSENLSIKKEAEESWKSPHLPAKQDEARKGQEEKAFHELEKKKT